MNDLKNIDCIQALRSFLLKQDTLKEKCPSIFSVPQELRDFPYIHLDWGGFWGEGWMKSCIFTITLCTATHNLEDNLQLSYILEKALMQTIPIIQTISLRPWPHGTKKTIHKSSSLAHIFNYRGTLFLET